MICAKPEVADRRIPEDFKGTKRRVEGAVDATTVTESTACVYNSKRGTSPAYRAILYRPSLLHSKTAEFVVQHILTTSVICP